MKNLFLLLLLLASSITIAQDLSTDEVYERYIGGRKTEVQLKEGIRLLENNCVDSEKYNCNRIQAIAYYKLSNEYYYLADQCAYLDEELAAYIASKAQLVFDKATSFMSLDDFTHMEKNIMLKYKNGYQSFLDKKARLAKKSN
jgi:hypothetical protein